MSENYSFLEKMKKLKEVQLLIAKTDAEIAIKEGKGKIQDLAEGIKKVFTGTVDPKKENLSEEKRNLVVQYEDIIKSVNESYESLLQDIMQRKMELEAEETKTMVKQRKNIVEYRNVKHETEERIKHLKSESEKNMRAGKLKEAKANITELEKIQKKDSIGKYEKNIMVLQNQKEEMRRQIQECKEQYAQALQARQRALDELRINRKSDLVEMNKAEFWESEFGKKLSKVMENTNNTVKSVTETLAKIRRKSY